LLFVSRHHIQFSGVTPLIRRLIAGSCGTIANPHGGRIALAQCGLYCQYHEDAKRDAKHESSPE
jgi:hypothetical protein